MTYPVASDAAGWLRWVNVGFVATSFAGEVVWSQNVEPADAVVWNVTFVTFYPPASGEHTCTISSLA